MKIISLMVATCLPCTTTIGYHTNLATLKTEDLCTIYLLNPISLSGDLQKLAESAERAIQERNDALKLGFKNVLKGGLNFDCTAYNQLTIQTRHAENGGFYYSMQYLTVLQPIKKITASTFRQDDSSQILTGPLTNTPIWGASHIGWVPDLKQIDNEIYDIARSLFERFALDWVEAHPAK